MPIILPHQLFFFLFLFSYFLVEAQEKNFPLTKDAEEKLNTVNRFLAKSDFIQADQKLEELLKQYPQHPEINFKTGFCYLHSTHREKSLPFFLKVYKSQPDYHHNLGQLYDLSSDYIQSFAYYLGQAYQFNHLFKEAGKFYQLALEEYQNIKKENSREKLLAEEMGKRIELTQKKLEECTYGFQYISEPVNAQIDNVGNFINSKYGDYAPVISANGKVMVFTSRRPGNVGGEVDPRDGKFYEDIYITYFKDGVWTSPENIGRPVNSKFHDACIALSADGREIFIYKDNNDGTGDIYVTDLKTDGSWEVPRSLGKNINTKYHEPSISMTAEGKRVYFSSNRPGGYGGLDIYYSDKLPSGEWGEAVNLGPTINTPYNEDAPYISPSGEVFYFSSVGHLSMGGYDIYSSKLENKEWSSPVNLGFPINTSDDDIYFVISADGQNGYYASAKEGGYGDKDIYVIAMPRLDLARLDNDLDLGNLPENQKIELNTVDIQKGPKVWLRGVITDKVTGLPLESNVQLILMENNEILEDITSEPQSGGYSSTKIAMSKSYLLTVQKEGYLFHSETFKVPQSYKDEEIIINVALEKILLGNKINLKIFFDFDKAYLRKESMPELKRLLVFMQKNPGIKIEIAGHTDNIGTNQKNQILSEQRAKAVADFLMENRIPEERIRYKGYGFAKPLAANQNSDGSDNHKGRQLNRRTECEIVEIVN